MTRLEFKSELSRRLEVIPFAERQKTLDYYDEMICDRVDDGMSEAEAVAAMGSIDEIAVEILSQLSYPPAEVEEKSPEKPDRSKKALAILLAAVLSPIWIPASVAIILTILAIVGCAAAALATLVAMIAAAALSGIALIGHSVYLTFTATLSYALLELGVGIACIGLGLVMLPLVWKLGEAMLACVRRFAAWVKSKIGRRKAHEG